VQNSDNDEIMENDTESILSKNISIQRCKATSLINTTIDVKLEEEKGEIEEIMKNNHIFRNMKKYETVKNPHLAENP
jgi:5'(3')-deoxyribonucleotidase